MRSEAIDLMGVGAKQNPKSSSITRSIEHHSMVLHVIYTSGRTDGVAPTCTRDAPRVSAGNARERCRRTCCLHPCVNPRHCEKCAHNLDHITSGVAERYNFRTRRNQITSYKDIRTGMWSSGMVSILHHASTRDDHTPRRPPWSSCESFVLTTNLVFYPMCRFLLRALSHSM